MTGLPDGGQSGSNDFSHPVYLAASTDPMVTIGSGCGTSAGISGTQIHIPAQARPTTSSDAHMGVIQPNGDEYDFWDVTNPAGNWTTGSTLHCSESGAYSNIVTGTGSLTYSATSGAALSAGNLRANELQNGVISHALFVVIPSSNGYVYPGTANAAQGGSIPIGARVQLKWTDAQIDAMTGQAAWEKTLLHQLHDYGLYVLDTGGDGYLTYKWESFDAVYKLWRNQPRSCLGQNEQSSCDLEACRNQLVDRFDHCRSLLRRGKLLTLPPSCY